MEFFFSCFLWWFIRVKWSLTFKIQKKIWPMSARFYIFSALMIAKCVHTYVYILSLYMNSQTNKPLNWFNSLKKHITVLKNHLWRNERLLNSYKRREKTIVALYYGLESKQCGLTGINMNFHAALREISGDTCAYEPCIRESLYQYTECVRLRLVTRLGGNNVVVNVVNSY